MRNSYKTGKLFVLGDVKKMTDFLDLLQKSLAVFPSETAVIASDGQSVSRAEFALTLNVIGSNASAAGIAKGMRVATLLGDEWSTGAIVLGLCSQVSILPLNPGLALRELTEQLRDARVSVLIADPSFPAASDLSRALNIPILDMQVLLRSSPMPDLSLPTVAADIAPGLVLLTSGSTGTPKRVPIAPEAMMASATSIIETLKLGRQDRALLALPMFHIGAFVDLLLAPLISGGTTIVAPKRDATSLLQKISEDNPTWIQLVPTMLVNLLNDPNADTVFSSHPLRFIRSVSASLASELQSEAEERFGCPIIQIYGMTETAGQICSNPLPPVSRKPDSVGQMAGAEITIRDTQGAVLPMGQIGEICIQGPTVFAGYEGLQAASQFFGDWFRSGDLGRLDEDGFLFLEGRLKEVINSSGEKISPFEIERAALRHPDIQEAAAYAIPHPTLGEHVGLSVVGTSGVSEADLLSHLSTQLAPFKCPRKIHILDAMPRLGSAKIDKLTLAKQAADIGQAGEAIALQGHELRVAEIWARILNTGLPDYETDFFDAGGDSLSATTLIVELEQAFQADISPNVLFDYPTFGALSHAVATEVGPRVTGNERPDPVRYAHRAMAGWPGDLALAGSVIRRLGQETDRPPLFWCCQGYSEIQPVHKSLNGQRPLYVMASLFRYPDRTEADSDELAAYYALEIQRICPGGPLNLGGFCSGAMIMEMVGHHLTRAGRTIGAFISIDHRFREVSPYPVIHFHSTIANPTDRLDFAFPVFHPAGAKLISLPVDHDGLMDHLSATEPDFSKELDGITGVAAFDTSKTLQLEQRHKLYKGAVKANLPWRLSSCGTDRARVWITNKSDEIWYPTQESGLALEVLLINLDGSTRARSAGYAELDRALAPGERCELSMTVNTENVSGPVFLMFLMKDHCITDFPLKSGAWCLRPRWPSLMRQD